MRWSLLLVFQIWVQLAAQPSLLLQPVSYTSKQGLPSNYVYGAMPFAQDSLGFMWIGTGRGLVRFDGTVFQPLEELLEAGSALAEAMVTSLLCDHLGDLWIGTLERGLFRLRQSTGELDVFRFDSNNPNSIRDNRINCLYLDSGQNLWIGTDSKGICRFEPDTEHFTSIELVPFNPVLDGKDHFANTVLRMEEHPATPDLLWIGTLGGLFAYDYREDIMELCLMNPPGTEAEAAESIRDFHIGADGRIWMGTWGNGLWSYHPEEGRSRRHFFPESTPRQNNIKAIERLSDTLLLLAAPQYGLGIFDTQSEQVVWLHEQEFERDHIATPGSFFRDGQGNLWIGTFEEGFYLLLASRNRFPHYHVPVDDLVRIVPSPDGQTLYAVSGFSFRLMELHLKRGVLKTYEGRQDTLMKRKFHDLRFNSDTLWLLTNYDLLTWDGRTSQLEDYPLPYFDTLNREYSVFLSMSIDRAGDIWMGTNWAGMFRLNTHTGDVMHFHSKSPAPYRPVHGFWIHPMDVDEAGRVWYATMEGFGYFDPMADRFVNYPYRSDNSDVAGVEFKHIRYVYPECSERIWIASAEKGLGLIRAGQPATEAIRTFTRAQGLSSDQVRHICSDGQGRIWLSHSKGLSYYLPEEDRFENLGPEFGFPGGMRLCRLPDGSMVAYHSSGLYHIDPENLASAPAVVSAHITRFRIFDKELGTHNPLGGLSSQRLRYDQNFISFEFQAIAFGQAEQVEYSCKLEGVDEYWVQTGNRAFTGYTNLRGGRYRFQVKARVGEGPWGSPAVMELHIVPAIWQTRWFWAVIALTVLLVAILGYQTRIQRIQEEEALKRHLAMQISEAEMTALRAQMNPHFLFNSLNSIRVFIIENDARSASHYLNRFARLIRLILENSRHSTVSLADELEAISLYVELESLRLEHRFRFQLDIPGSISTENLEVPPLILQPFVENAIWHGLTYREQDGLLRIQVEERDQSLVCIIEDNGVGREMAQQLRSNTGRKSMGLAITSNRLKLLSETFRARAKFQLEDILGPSGNVVGTRATIFLPLLRVDSARKSSPL